MPKYTTASAQQTFKLGQTLAAKLKSGLTLALIGDLGTGKTVFAQGLAAGLNIAEPITSPTFIIMKIYPIPNHKYLKQFCHIDAYRLKNEKDLIAIGADEYLNNPQAVVLIEWAEKVKSIWPPKIEIIAFKHKSPSCRIIKTQTFNL